MAADWRMRLRPYLGLARCGAPGVEAVARLIHETWRERLGSRLASTWNTLSDKAREDYRAAARAVLRLLGNKPDVPR